jgi:hypothetical protein
MVPKASISGLSFTFGAVLLMSTQTPDTISIFHHRCALIAGAI